MEITPLDTNDFGGADLDQNPNQDLNQDSNQDQNQDEFQLELGPEPELFTIAPLLTSEVEEEAPAAELDPADEAAAGGDVPRQVDHQQVDHRRC